MDNPKCCPKASNKKNLVNIKFLGLVNNREEIDSSIFEFKSDKYDFIGHVRNTYYIATANVYSALGISIWINNHFKKELFNRGYTIIEDSNFVSYSKDDISLEGKILLVYTDSYFNYDAKIDLEIIFKEAKSDKILLQKLYQAESKSPNLLADTEGFRNVLENSLRIIISKILIDLEELNYTPKK